MVRAPGAVFPDDVGGVDHVSGVLHDLPAGAVHDIYRHEVRGLLAAMQACERPAPLRWSPLHMPATAGAGELRLHALHAPCPLPEE